MLGYNMFAYCENNPILYTDYTGESLFVTLVVLCSFFAIPTVIITDSIMEDDLSTIDNISVHEQQSIEEGYIAGSKFTQRNNWYSVEGGVLKNDEQEIISAETGLEHNTFSWEYFEVEVGEGKASGRLSSGFSNGVGASASIEAIYGSVSIVIPFGSHKLKIGLSGSVGSIGVGASIGGKTGVDIALGLGGGFFIEWD